MTDLPITITIDNDCDHEWEESVHDDYNGG